jgi:hypothetical protein
VASRPSPTPNPPFSDAASNRLDGAAEAELRARWPNNQTIRLLDERGLPLTRQNYIDARGHDGEWTYEDESNLPRELQLD